MKASKMATVKHLSSITAFLS